MSFPLACAREVLFLLPGSGLPAPGSLLHVESGSGGMDAGILHSFSEETPYNGILNVLLSGLLTKTAP